jgi:membrane-associated phospholipid phosphatase
MTDVLAGYALGAAWVALLIAVAIIVGRHVPAETDEGAPPHRLRRLGRRPARPAIGRPAAV